MLIYFDDNLVILLNYLGGNWRMLQTWIAIIHADIFKSQIFDWILVLFVHMVNISHGISHLFFELMVVDGDHEGNQQTEKDAEGN